MSTMPLDDLGGRLRRIAEDLARAAGDMALAGRRRGLVEVSTKSSPTDMVTEFDRASEAMIVEGLLASRPDDAIVGEEGASRPGTTGVEWCIDPIDGTSNFYFDLPTWAVSIGARDADGPLAGAVYAPALGEMYLAHRGGGATLNGSVISCRNNSDLADALVVTGFSYSPAERVRQSRRIPLMIDKIRDVRRFGAAAIDLCFVASGRADAYFEENLHWWDLVAGQLIVTEAGGIVTDFAGGVVHPSNVLAAGRGVHAAMVDLLAAPTTPGTIDR